MTDVDPMVYGDWDNGVLWIERRSAPWPYISRAAMRAASLTDGYRRHHGVVYEGIRAAIRVTDEHEMPCSVMDPDDPPCTCCRVIEAHQFVIVRTER